MMSLKKTLALAAVALAACLGIAACGGDDDGDGGAATTPQTETTTNGGPGEGAATAPKTPAEPEIETIVVRGGAPVGGPAKLEYDAGERVRFRVRSDTADELHVHGYDVTAQLRPGKAATVSFPADLEGIFEVELHGSGEQIAELQVNP